MEVSLTTNENFKKNSTLIFIINACAFLLFFVFGYISILRISYSGLLLNLYSDFSLNIKNIGILKYFMGLEMDEKSLYAFYFSILFICLINLIILIKYFVKESNLEKYFNGNYSQFIFIPLILFTILNFFGYPKLKVEIPEKFIKIPYVRLSFSLVICIIGLIILCGLYFLSFIKKNKEEANEDNPNYSLKIFYEVLLIFYLYYFFHLIQLLRLKGKIKYYDDYDDLMKKEHQIPLKFQVTMACIIETVFGLIGLVIIILGESFTYAFYQIFIYVAFLIIRADDGKIEENPNFPKIKLNACDYVVSVIVLLATLVCLCFLMFEKQILLFYYFIFIY